MFFGAPLLRPNFHIPKLPVLDDNTNLHLLPNRQRKSVKMQFRIDFKVVLASQQGIAHIQGIEKIPDCGRIERMIARFIDALRRDIVGRTTFAVIDKRRIVLETVQIHVERILDNRIGNCDMAMDGIYNENLVVQRAVRDIRAVIR